MAKKKNKSKKPVKEEKLKNNGGRPTKYEDIYCEQVYKLCLLGATDKEIANFFGIAESTLNLWKLNYSEFSESIKKGKIQADAEVAKSLYHRACGYEHPDVHISSYEGKITITNITKYYPPDTGAAMAWLKNRTRKQEYPWRDDYSHDVKGINVADIAALMRNGDGK